MPQDKVSYWAPRVMRHHSAEGSEEYAIHEVYFSQDDRVVTYTVDALSPREASVEALKGKLLDLVHGGDEEMTLGDLGYTYVREDLEHWLEYVDQPPIDYEPEEA